MFSDNAWFVIPMMVVVVTLVHYGLKFTSDVG